MFARQLVGMGVSVYDDKLLYCVCYECTAMRRVVCADTGDTYVHLFDVGLINKLYAFKGFVVEVSAVMAVVLANLGGDYLKVSFAVEGEAVSDVRNSLVEEGVVKGNENYDDYGSSY